MALTTITLLKDYRCFKKGDVFELKKFNLLVGDQGCGKSTLLQLLVDWNKGGRDMIQVEHTDELKKYVFFDFERDNPRTASSPKAVRNPKTNLAAELSLLWKSHGEAVLRVIRSVPLEKPSLVLMDEPDMALSPKSIIHLQEILMKMKNTHQIILAAHNPILIALAENVFNLEMRVWQTPGEYFKTMNIDVSVTILS